jgi:hypothetical protein
LCLIAHAATLDAVLPGELPFFELKIALPAASIAQMPE